MEPDPLWQRARKRWPRFAHGIRKLGAAKADFDELGVDLRAVTDKTVAWWEPAAGEEGL
jgi:hypothetical protein